MHQKMSSSIGPVIASQNREARARHRQPANKAQPLTLTRVGRAVHIASVTVGRTMQSRLASLGLLPGEQIQVVRQGQFGPIVVSVKGARLALGRGVAHKILVTEAPGG